MKTFKQWLSEPTTNLSKGTIHSIEITEEDYQQIQLDAAKWGMDQAGKLIIWTDINLKHKDSKTPQTDRDLELIQLIQNDANSLTIDQLPK